MRRVRKRITATAEKRTMPKGRPFKKGEPSPNPRGRPKKKKLSPAEALLKPLMQETVIIVDGKRKRITRLEAISEQQSRAVLQKDYIAARALATLARATATLVTLVKADDVTTKPPVHDAKAIARMMEAYDTQVIEAHLRGRSNDQAPAKA
jgi:hypothetical protein